MNGYLILAEWAMQKPQSVSVNLSITFDLGSGQMQVKHGLHLQEQSEHSCSRLLSTQPCNAGEGISI